MVEQIKHAFEPFFGKIDSVQVLIKEDLAIGVNVPNWEKYEEISL